MNSLAHYLLMHYSSVNELHNVPWGAHRWIRLMCTTPAAQIQFAPWIYWTQLCWVLQMNFQEAGILYDETLRKGIYCIIMGNGNCVAWMPNGIVAWMHTNTRTQSGDPQHQSIRLVVTQTASGLSTGWSLWQFTPFTAPYSSSDSVWINKQQMATCRYKCHSTGMEAWRHTGEPQDPCLKTCKCVQSHRQMDNVKHIQISSPRTFWMGGDSANHHTTARGVESIFFIMKWI